MPLEKGSMMRPHLLFAAALLAAMSGIEVQAGPICWLKSFGRTFKQNNMWPEPFIYADRDAVRAPFAIMVHNGWRRQNTLTDAHFELNGAELTEAGRLRIRWIVTQAPESAKTIYVLRTDDPERTAARIMAAEEAAAKYALGGVIPPVLETQKAYESTPADYIDEVDRKFRETTPDPRLPDAEESDAEGT
jgi:hypothetical protein